MSYQPVSSRLEPSPYTLVRRLRKQHPAIYKELTTDFQPLQHDFSLIDSLYEGTDDRVLFFGAILLLFGKYSDPLTMPNHHLHHGTGNYLVKVTGLFLPNISNFISQAQAYFKMPGFREDVTEYIKQVAGIKI